MKIAVLHGPNLNLLGTREPEVYGHTTLQQVNDALETFARGMEVDLSIYQSNHEGDLIDRIHAEAPTADGFLVNAAGLTHTSVVLADALAGVARPYVEVHLSNVFAREGFRHHSYLAPRAVGVVSGFGPNSYLVGMWALTDHLKERAALPGAPEQTT